MTLLIKSSDETTAFLVGDKNEIKIIATYFQFQPEGYMFMPGYRMGYWDGFIYPINKRTGEFKKGLAAEIIRKATELGYDCALCDVDWVYLDKKIDMCPMDNISNGSSEKIEPYDFQQSGVNYALTNKRCIIESPTGSGKSLMQYLLLRSLLNTNNYKKVLFIVPTISLVSQLYGDFCDYSENDSNFNTEEMCHKIAEGSDKNSDKQIYISTWQSLQNIKDKRYFEEFDTVIVDECLAGNTLITLADNTQKQIKDIKIGDIIKTYNEKTNKIENNKVKKLHKNLSISSKEKMLEIKLDDGNTLNITGNHKVLTKNRGWVRADSLDIDDDIIDFNPENILNKYKEDISSASQNISKWLGKNTNIVIDKNKSMSAQKQEFIDLIFSKNKRSCSVCNNILTINKQVLLLRKREHNKIFCSSKCLYINRSNNMVGDNNSYLKLSNREKNILHSKQANTLKQKILNTEYSPPNNRSRGTTYIKLQIDNTILNMRSSWEALFFLSNIKLNLQYEKIRIPYIDEHNKSRIYISDFYDDISNIIYEVKPIKFINTNSELKRIATEKLGYNFKYITEHDIETYKVSNSMLEQYIINFTDVQHRFIGNN